MNGYQERYGRSMMGTFGAPLRKLERGEGCWVWDSEGNRILDFLGGIAVNALGHAHPVFVDTVARQAASVAHVSNYFASEPQLALAERLVRLSGAGEQGRVFFANSGTEAMEAAFKLARLHRPHGRVIALHNGFHGRTMGALTLTAKASLREPFAPLVPGVEHIEASVQALEAAFEQPTSVAALVMELIQGEAGVVPISHEFIVRARELTAEHGALLILDEIQTGVGRTGAWFAFQHHGIVPDAMALAKGLGGGIPIGALITFGATSALFGVGQHGSTFGGNPLATAVGEAVVGEIERAGLVANAARRGAELRAAIEALDTPLIDGVRGEGLLLGIRLTQPLAAKVAAAALELGLIVNAPNETTIRIAPPLTIGDDEVREFLAILPRALEAALADAAKVTR